MTCFKAWSSLSQDERNNHLAGVRPQELDCDKWEVFMTPAEYLAQFNGPINTLTLASRVPKSNRVRKAVTSHRDDGLSDVTENSDSDAEGERAKILSSFFLLAKNGHLLWIDLQFKADFFKKLKVWRSVTPANNNLVGSYGALTVAVTQFVQALVAIGCDTIWLKGYGAKKPVTSFNDDCGGGHTLSHLNQWDFGVTYKSPSIWLFAPAEVSKVVTGYPMVIPGSLDFGSVKCDLPWDGHNYRVKVYPRLVHCIKSHNSRIQGERPRTFAGVRKRHQACDKVVHALSSDQSSDLGGFRIEVTVTAPTFMDACDKIQYFPFMRPSWWLSPKGPEGTEPGESLNCFKLDVKLVTKQGLLENARWVSQRASDKGLMAGNNSTAVTAQMRRVTCDILCSFGWNAGQGHITKSLSPSAWWLDSPVTEADQGVTVSLPSMSETSRASTTLSQLTSLFTGSPGVKRLRDLIKKLNNNVIPCPKGSVQDGHKLHSKGTSPVRFICALPPCKSHMNQAQAVKWFAELCDKGIISREGLGLPPLPQQHLATSNQQVTIRPTMRQDVLQPSPVSTVTLVTCHI